MTYSPHGSATDVALVKNHEGVHSFLAPKSLNGLRQFRAEVGMAAYEKIELVRYLEEALAESYAQVKVNGLSALPAGIKFPITNGYLELKPVVGTVADAVLIYAGSMYAVDVVANGSGE